MIGTALDVALKHSIGRSARGAQKAAQRHRHALPSGNVHRVALLWMLLFAFVWQGFVAQTHRHPNPVAIAAATTLASPDQSPAGDQPSDTPANCSICRELASSGPALLPVAAAIAAPGDLPFVEAAASLPRPTLVRRTRPWQSRAPPFLQA